MTKQELNGEAGPVNLLADDHRELDRRFDELVRRAKGSDETALGREWTSFERDLLRHLELEEAEILRGFAREDAAGARGILAEHAMIRSDLLELGISLDLHQLDTEAVQAFVQRLKDHARREEATLYAWARRHITASGWEAIKDRLASSDRRL